MSQLLSVVLAGGGTAGHVSPLLAMADALKAAAPQARITVIGTAEGLESRLVPAAGYELRLIERVPMPRRPDLDALRFPVRYPRAVRASRAILDEVEADVVVGVGGYVSTPVYAAARKAGVPIVVHEANARAGLANRVGAKHAAVVGAAFDGTGLPGARIVGMPMRSGIAQLDRAALRAQARSDFGLRPEGPVLLVTGGSLGAASLNRAVLGAAPALGAAGVQILHVTGRGKAMLGEGGAPFAAPGYTQVEYVDGMERAYAAADLVLCRSGAGTVCELAAVGLPSVLVPLPIGNGEQRLNGAPLVEAGGALMVDDAQLSAAWILEEVLPLITDPARLAGMEAASRAHGVRDAAQKMAELIIGSARKGERA
ncbi:MAG: undecaprenyldiphospho-muramoylpentapeptide beta-N-acetylglucosaminyltransferase [Arthrobacter sp.]|jgi:UDP-N-acetylglucosamine--N-acetylmuramyl-(pentapeptide) pyrophosphoryl-undecaprenol N-acetylglucosamine transferase|nr:undecaprenyldiphospho-muramoylpentapeptide beta-N-acetylglucosaminyltransferase [Arthrobacter sp.]